MGAQESILSDQSEKNLPNGKPAPCFSCKKDVHNCKCVFEVPGTQAQPRRKNVCAAQIDGVCQNCGNADKESCICPNLCDETEKAVRRQQTIETRIVTMMKFSNLLMACKDRDESVDKQQNALMTRGDDLLAQHKVLMDNRKSGALTGEIMQFHFDSVASWLEKCDQLHSALCKESAVVAEEFDNEA